MPTCIGVCVCVCLCVCVGLCSQAPACVWVCLLVSMRICECMATCGTLDRVAGASVITFMRCQSPYCVSQHVCC